MKKIFILLFLSFLPLEALYFGNPANPSFYNQGIFRTWDENFYSFRFGYYGDFVFDRYLENHLGDIEKTRLMTNAAYFVFGMKIAEVYATFGESKLTMFSPANSFVLEGPLDTNPKVDLFFRENFSWSIGARAELFQYRWLTVGVAGQYFLLSPELDCINVFQHFENIHSRNLSWHEWQIGLGCSLDFATTLPCFTWSLYSAVTYSRCYFTTNNVLLITSETTLLGQDLFLQNCCARKNVGLAIGATVAIHTKAGITVEASFFDAKAVSAVLEINY